MGGVIAAGVITAILTSIANYFMQKHFKKQLSEHADKKLNASIEASRPQVQAAIDKSLQAITDAQAEGRTVSLATTYELTWGEASMDPRSGLSIGQTLMDARLVDVQVVLEGQPARPYSPPRGEGALGFAGDLAKQAFRQHAGQSVTCETVTVPLTGTDEEARKQREVEEIAKKKHVEEQRKKAEEKRKQDKLAAARAAQAAPPPSTSAPLLTSPRPPEVAVQQPPRRDPFNLSGRPEQKSLLERSQDAADSVEALKAEYVQEANALKSSNLPPDKVAEHRAKVENWVIQLHLAYQQWRTKGNPDWPSVKRIEFVNWWVDQPEGKAELLR